MHDNIHLFSYLYISQKEQMLAILKNSNTTPTDLDLLNCADAYY